MNKKGFTLVEMLAVVVILGLVLMVALPRIQNQLSEKKVAVSDVTMEMIGNAAELLTTADPSTYQKVYNDEENYSTYCITLQELVDKGYLEAPITDYTTGDELNLKFVVKAKTNQYQEFEYELVHDTSCDTSSTELVYYHDSTLPEGTYPALEAGMIPVVYKNGNWVKASVYESWYSYSKDSNGYRWANMVTVNSKASTCDEKDDCIDGVQKHTRTYYERAVAGTKISADDINGMYVWIPRFEYKIGSNYGTDSSKVTTATSPGIIDVTFVGKSVTSPSSGYTIHPAFTYSTLQLGGFWMAKFQASADATSRCTLNDDAANCNRSGTRYNNLTVTPNKNAWRYVSLETAFTVATSLSTNTTYYGLKSTQTESHLTRNSEWAAVAYLSQSQYGNYGNKYKDTDKTKNTSGEEIYVNKIYNNGTSTGCTNGRAGNNLSILTKCSATLTTNGSTATYTTNYNYEASYRGSTSGTIYGIFDMAGGVWEYAMGNFKKNSGSSGLVLEDIYEEGTDEEGNPIQVLKTKAIDDRYYDKFTTTSKSSEQKGQALLVTELGLSGTNANWWIDSYSFNLSDTSPWLIRGGSYDMTSEQIGIFAVSTATGATSDKIGFRPVLISKK